jgi:NAD(P)-dependent dehydrogenase (short-subunit alcohol dehydrogenase family)
MKDKVVIITGGGSGIGRATAMDLAQKGASVIVSDIDEYGMDKTCGKILQNGGEALAIKCDVTKKSEVEELIDFTMERFGRIDSLINNAGIGGDLAFMESYDDDMYDRVMNINVRGVWLCLKAVLPIMKAQNEGTIVNVSSVAGLGAAARMSAYAASKHAVIGLTKTVANEYGKYNVRVNAVCPTVIDTPMGRSYLDQNEEVIRMIKSVIPMKRFGEAFEVAQTIAWLCSEDSSFVTGQAIAIDGGMKS